MFSSLAGEVEGTWFKEEWYKRLCFNLFLIELTKIAGDEI